MTFVIDMQQSRKRASKRVAGVATVATLLPDVSSKVAGVARVASKNVCTACNPLFTVEQTDRGHTPSRGDVEIEAFAKRRDRLLREGYAAQEADGLAERLTVRDCESDDRRMCLECSHLADNGSCIAAASGRTAGTERRLEAARNFLQRCEGFDLRRGLTRKPCRGMRA